MQPHLRQEKNALLLAYSFLRIRASVQEIIDTTVSAYCVRFMYFLTSLWIRTLSLSKCFPVECSTKLAKYLVQTNVTTDSHEMMKLYKGMWKKGFSFFSVQQRRRNIRVVRMCSIRNILIQQHLEKPSFTIVFKICW